MDARPTSPRGSAKFWVLVVAAGLLSGGGAVLLVQGLRLLQRVFWRSESEAFFSAASSVSPGLRFSIALLAGVLISGVAVAVAGPLKGHGTSGILESIWNNSGRMPLVGTLLKAVMSIVAVALGAPLGREGALLQAGAASGSALGRRFNLEPHQVRLLVACGASRCDGARGTARRTAHVVVRGRAPVRAGFVRAPSGRRPAGQVDGNRHPGGSAAPW